MASTDSIFRTVTPLRKGLEGIVSHNTPVLTFGSCFADNIASRLEADGFTVLANPFGTLYNPMSIAEAVTLCCAADKIFTDSDLMKRTEAGKTIYCWVGGSTIFEDENRSNLLHNIARVHKEASSFIAKAGVLTLTLGTATCFTDNRTGKTVANCHKIPGKNFTRRRLSVKECTDVLAAALSDLRGINPGIRIILTISPYRYLGYGCPASHADKGTLFLAAEEIGRIFPDIIYFPAFEMITDDLRDYRFYAADMLHPSEQAADYVYSGFAETFFDANTRNLAAGAAALYRFASHKSSNPESHLEAILDKAQLLTEKNPVLAAFVERLIKNHSSH